MTGSNMARAMAVVRRWTQVRPDGLPNRIVVWWFPVLVTVLLIVAVLADVSGSSTGVLWTMFHRGKDPDLLLGQPRAIRSDEWFVQSSWLVSQHAQGFARVNDVFPGGMDATVMNDTPTWDWSSLFRPPLWGSLVLGLGRGLAFRWWAQAWMIVVPVYAFVVSMLPRRPLLGALMALAVVFQPLLQWWWFPATTLPVAFAFMAMTAVIWALRSSTVGGRVATALAAAYLAVSMAMSIYAPNIIAVIFPTAAFAAGLILIAYRHDAMSARLLVRRLLPLIGATIGAGAVMVVWVLTRLSTVTALLATVYPGQRFTPPGTVAAPFMVDLLSGPFQGELRSGGIPGIPDNQSESAAALTISLVLVVPMLAMLIGVWRRQRYVDWLLLFLIGVQLFVLAYLFVPGWDPIAHLLIVDRSLPPRMKLSFVVMDGVSMVALIARARAWSVTPSWLIAAATGGVSAAASGWVWLRLHDAHHGLPRLALVVAILLGLGLTLLARGWFTIGVVGVTVCSVLVGVDVNPLYRGIFDLTSDTPAGRTVVALHKADPEARWVGIGSWAAIGTLFEAAVPAYSGMQTYPPKEMWRQIDPAGASENAWNRLAHLTWVPGAGDPAPRQPPSHAPDEIDLTFDSCAPFAQRYVRYVLSDVGPVDQPCLSLIRAFPSSATSEWIYQVRPAPGAAVAGAGRS